MNSLTYLREYQNLSRRHLFRMLSRTFPSSVLLKPLMNTLPPPPKNGSFAHLNYSSYCNHLINACVTYDATNASTPSKIRNVYAAAGTQDFTLVEEPHKTQFSQDIDTPSDDFYQLPQAKLNKSPLHHYMGSRAITQKSQLPLHPRSILRNMMVLSMFLQKFTNFSDLKLLLPSIYTILRPSTNLARKEVFMSLTFLTMNYLHLRIPLLSNNLTHINLMMHLKVRLTQF